MENFFNSLPRWLQVGGALIIGLILIFLFNPPHTVCDSQFEVFKKNQTSFVYIDPTKKFMDENEFEISKRACAERKSAGSCYQYFEGLKQLMRDIQTSSLECRSTIAGRSEVKNMLWQSLGFIFELAWGTTPPTNSYEKLGWLDNVHVDVFCNLQNLIRENFSEDEWVEFRENTLKNLPGASTLDRKEVWSRSLFTVKCSG